MTTPNMSLTMGSAASLGAAPYSKEGGHDKHSGMQQACSMGVDAPVGTSGPTLALATSEATQAAGARTDAAAGPQPALAFSSVDIVIGCNVLKRRSLQDADKVLASMYKLLAPGGEFSCSESECRSWLLCSCQTLLWMRGVQVCSGTVCAAAECLSSRRAPADKCGLLLCGLSQAGAAWAPKLGLLTCSNHCD